MKMKIKNPLKSLKNPFKGWKKLKILKMIFVFVILAIDVVFGSILLSVGKFEDGALFFFLGAGAWWYMRLIWSERIYEPWYEVDGDMTK